MTKGTDATEHGSQVAAVGGFGEDTLVYPSLLSPSHANVARSTKPPR